MPRTTGQQRRGGRILPHQRDTNDDVAILGENLDDIGGNFQQNYNEVKKHAMSDKNRKDYRCRIIRVCKYWKEHCPDYYAIGVKKVTNEDLHDASKYYYGRYKYDLVYSGLNVNYLLHYMMSNSKKASGKVKSKDDMRKYKDAVMWGAQVAGERLPTKFYKEMDKYLLSYKKQFIKAKKDGDVDETEADPIPVTLYQEILRWAIEENNIFVWHWTLQQWGCIARCANIDPLAFHNYRVGQDSIICKYDDSKADKTGEKLAEKNLYANPFEYTQCSWTGLGIYTALNCDALSVHERFFLAKGVEEGAAAKRYCEQLVSVIAGHHQELMTHMRSDHFNPYGFRKGSATFAVSGTTHAPSLPSVARRGEWSQGVVLDVYLHFASAGDHYLGRILACLKPNQNNDLTDDDNELNMYCSPVLLSGMQGTRQHS